MSCSHYIRGLNNVEELEECKREEDEDTMPVDFFCQVRKAHPDSVVVMRLVMMMTMMIMRQL